MTCNIQSNKVYFSIALLSYARICLWHWLLVMQYSEIHRDASQIMKFLGSKKLQIFIPWTDCKFAFIFLWCITGEFMFLNLSLLIELSFIFCMNYFYNPRFNVDQFSCFTLGKTIFKCSSCSIQYYVGTMSKHHPYSIYISLVPDPYGLTSWASGLTISGNTWGEYSNAGCDVLGL